MKIFIGVKYEKERLDLIPDIKRVIEGLGHEPYCFATDAEKTEDAKEMMKLAFNKIDEADVVLLEASESSFGVGIEAGYAFSKGKKIISIAKDVTEASKTIKGVSNHYLVYKDFEDLKEKLRKVL